MNKLYAKTIASIIAISCLGLLALGSDDPDSKNHSSETQSTSTQPEKTYKLNEQVPVGKFIYNVSLIKVTKSIGDQRADGYFVIFGIVFYNNDKETRTVDGSLFTLYSEDGKEYDASTEANMALEMNGGKTIFLKQCGPGIMKSGAIVFEIPKKGNYKLKLSGGFFDASKAFVEIPIN
jgi:hypothetical protein